MCHSVPNVNPLQLCSLIGPTYVEKNHMNVMNGSRSLNPVPAAPFRFCLLALLIQAKFGTWTLEQPFTSIIFRHTRFQWLLRRLIVS